MRLHLKESTRRDYKQNYGQRLIDQSVQIKSSRLIGTVMNNKVTSVEKY